MGTLLYNNKINYNVTRLFLSVFKTMLFIVVIWGSCGKDNKKDTTASAIESPIVYEFRTVTISGSVWMVNNLDIVTDSSWCYDNDESNCKKYGRLYTWDIAMTICPKGWHLPDRSEWSILYYATNDWRETGTNLKSKPPDWNGIDGFGFSALPGGIRTPNGTFRAIGSWGYWWDATEDDDSITAHYHYMGSDYGVLGGHSNDKSNGYSVRCVKNEVSSSFSEK